jgi:hypothetical protein
MKRKIMSNPAEYATPGTTYAVTINEYDVTTTYKPDEFGEVLEVSERKWATEDGIVYLIDTLNSKPEVNHATAEVHTLGIQKGEPIREDWYGSLVVLD